jgi:hypothetical protein
VFSSCFFIASGSNEKNTKTKLIFIHEQHKVHKRQQLDCFDSLVSSLFKMGQQQKTSAGIWCLVLGFLLPVDPMKRIFKKSDFHS